MMSSADNNLLSSEHTSLDSVSEAKSQTFKDEKKCESLKLEVSLTNDSSSAEHYALSENDGVS